MSRLKRVWAREYEGWRDELLGDDQWVYIWADGIYSGLRGEEDKLCALVIIGVNALGQKKFLAIEDGVRESTQSWREVLLKLKDRGMYAPKLAVGPSQQIALQSPAGQWTVPWASGRHWTKYIPKRAINAAGSTKP